MKIILKIFFLNILLFFTLSGFAQTSHEYYRSNANGLQLVKISSSSFNDFNFVLKVFYNAGNMSSKLLYNKGKLIKKWNYFYSNNVLLNEKYFKDNIIKEEYFYDLQKHKIKHIEYKNGKRIKAIDYTYNKDGLVDTERIANLLNNQVNILRYKYDSNYRIKQIEKNYYDGRTVYWEAFFTSKGIITKEYYTLNNQTYTFWYNEFGQEIKGELSEYSENGEKLIKEWQIDYTDSGRIDSREEINYKAGKKIKTWYNSKYKETRIETYKNDKIFTIEIFDYNNSSQVIEYEIIEDLDSSKIVYTYDDDKKITKTLHFKNDKLKKSVVYNADNSRTELLYGNNDRVIMIEYDINGDIISQKNIDN